MPSFKYAAHASNIIPLQKLVSMFLLLTSKPQISKQRSRAGFFHLVICMPSFMSFCGFIVHFFLALNNIPLFGCIYHCSIIYNSFTVLKILCALPINPNYSFFIHPLILQIFLSYHMQCITSSWVFNLCSLKTIRGPSEGPKHPLLPLFLPCKQGSADVAGVTSWSS